MTGTGESSYQPGPADDAAMHCGLGLATRANAIAEAVDQSTGSLVDESLGETTIPPKLLLFPR